MSPQYYPQGHLATLKDKLIPATPASAVNSSFLKNLNDACTAFGCCFTIVVGICVLLLGFQSPLEQVRSGTFPTAPFNRSQLLPPFKEYAEQFHSYEMKECFHREYYVLSNVLSNVLRILSLPELVPFCETAAAQD
ncbi:unnamed protein product [Nippostrongylus brasiliensis]|uniref:Nucleoporin NDC1 n=1 Tax=Nippostrongylus brasiliensis TaxID=27835 RepID=A0A0N4YN13_NIPBR|nr:unnamed protein product [Nippostrongylus brasiliensis]